jgi:predicted nucleic acid-binding protein
VLIDDQARRQKTVGEGLQVAGTHSVLDEAERSSLVDSDEVVVDFQKTSFRIANVVLSEIRAKRSR